MALCQADIFRRMICVQIFFDPPPPHQTLVEKTATAPPTILGGLQNSSVSDSVLVP